MQHHSINQVKWIIEFILAITQIQVHISGHEKEIAHENIQEWKK